MPAGTDHQVFCYDEQNRLVWAGSTGTPPATCNGGTGPTLSPGTLTSAYYTQSFSYDAFNRLLTGPLGNYTYGSTAHQDAVTSIEQTGSPSYTASYDADGSMTCRAPTSSVTCTDSS